MPNTLSIPQVLDELNRLSVEDIAHRFEEDHILGYRTNYGLDPLRVYLSKHAATSMFELQTDIIRYKPADEWSANPGPEQQITVTGNLRLFGQRMNLLPPPSQNRLRWGFLSDSHPTFPDSSIPGLQDSPQA